MKKETSPIKFGTDGWRSLVAEDFTFPNVRLVAQSIAQYLKSHPAEGRPLKVIVGYDTRPLGDRFAEAVAEVLAGNGFEVLLTNGPMPTPAISFSIREFKLCGGIAVTASHNPFTYNGIKFKPYYAGPSEPEMTRWVEEHLGTEPLKQVAIADGLSTGKIKTIDLAPKYLSFVRGYVDWPLVKRAKFKVAYDNMHGAGQTLLQRLLEGSGIRVIPANDDPWPVHANHRPEPVGEHLKGLGAVVRKSGCHAGLATDGDADRLGLVGPDGKFVSSQETMALLLWHLLEDRKWRGLVVTTVSGTKLVDSMTAHYKVPLKRTPVGFKHIAAYMRIEDVLFGGEESGGFGFRGCVPERDGLLAGLLVLEMMAMRRQPLSTILREMRRRFGTWIFERADLVLSRPVSSEELKEWAAKNAGNGLTLAPGVKVKEIRTEDGVKVILDDESWLLLRPSGTEPLLRIYSEGKSQTQVKNLIESGKRIGLQIIGK
ncbi:MAG: phosphoglucomutase/phosphomannomutase family protein [Candidatus Omnitrophica bacterium]|nr:phosphoglucomutase/phosphomannomutase family protein [Candidatus Omnitrophota bacterium]